VSVNRRIRYQREFWAEAETFFSPHRTDDGRPSIDDFRDQGVKALTFDFQRPDLLPVEPGSPMVIAVLGAFLAMPPMVAYALLDRDPTSGLETVDVYDLDVDWGAWEALERPAGEEDDDW
jgi:hypothetical protein